MQMQNVTSLVVRFNFLKSVVSRKIDCILRPHEVSSSYTAPKMTVEKIIILHPLEKLDVALLMFYLTQKDERDKIP